MSALLERGLQGDRRRSAQAHLATCAACRAVLAAGARLQFDSVSSGAGENPLKPREPLLPPGTQVGRYELRAALGAGAAGVVYEAWDPQLKRAVAVKVLWREAAGRDGPAARTRLLAEAETMARLSHPHVVAVYDVGVFVSATGSEEVFIAIELVRDKPWRRGWARNADRGARLCRCLCKRGGDWLLCTRQASSTATLSRTTC